MHFNKLIYLLFFLIQFEFYAQNSSSNKLSVELNVGATRPFSALSKNHYTNYVGLFHVDAGARYMFLDKLGVKYDIGFDRIKNDEYGVFSTSLPFQSYFLRTNLNGIVNAGKILRFSDWTNRIGLLGHIGVGFSYLLGDTTKFIETKKTSNAQGMLNVNFGMTAQVKITEKFALTFVGSMVSNFKPEYNFDFKERAESKYGMIANMSLGGTYYIGSQKSHVDWDYKGMSLDNNDKPIKRPVVKSDSLLADLFDKDKDGILDSLDFCPEIPGVAAFNGCPESYAMNPYNSKELPIIIFNPSSTELSPEDLLKLDTIADFLKQNPSVRITLNGFSDNIGSKEEILDISNRRALNVKTELAKRGVNAARLNIKPKGAEKAVIPAEYEGKLDHNRVVTFEKTSAFGFDIAEYATGIVLKDLFYTVQVGVYRTPLSDVSVYEKYGKVLVAHTPGGYIRYNVAIIKNKKEAYALMNKLYAEKASKDAFVTAYYQGKKITLSQADNLAKGGTPFQK